jgi:dolichol-phosphate mannosyltransferase
MAMVPTYNEALNIENLLHEILKQGPDIGAVVVDDNSPDGTAVIVEKPPGRSQGPPDSTPGRTREGHGGDCGVSVCRFPRGRFRHRMDADFSHPPSYLHYFLSQMEDCDLLIGSRLLKGGGERGEFLRQAISRLASAYIRHILNLPIRLHVRLPGLSAGGSKSDRPGSNDVQDLGCRGGFVQSLQARIQD